MTKREKTILTFCCIGGGLFLGGKFGLARLGDNARANSCQSQLRQIALSFAQYAKDHDNRLPLVAVNDVVFSNKPFSKPYGWADAIQPQFKCTSCLQCPNDGFVPSQTGDAAHPGFTDYWMNKQLSGRKLAALKSPTAIVILGDGIGGPDSDARYFLSAPPDTQTLEGDDSVARSAWHHSGGANFAFVDGHVRWLASAQVSDKAGASFTFAIR